LVNIILAEAELIVQVAIVEETGSPDGIQIDDWL